MTRGSFGLPERGVSEWIARGVLALGLSAMGYVSVTHSLATVAAKIDPLRAHALAPSDGMIAAYRAEQEFSQRSDSAAGSTATRLARQALIAEPTAVKALTVLGFQAELRGDAAARDRIFRYSTWLSRRDLRSQVWAIEEAVTRGDIAGALHHYDIALRTSTEAQAMLFPVLTSALREPRVRLALMTVLAAKPAWTQAFVTFAATSGIEPRAVVRMFLDGRRIGLPVDNNFRASLVNALLAKGETSEAWAYYTTFRGAADRRRSRDPLFALAADARAGFDWTPGGEPGVSAAILQSSRDRGRVDFALPASAGGVIVRQTQLLPAGAYRLSGRTTGIQQPERSLPYWVLTCADGRELGRIVVPNSSQANGVFEGRFTVPQGCPVQTLSLVARASDEIGGVSGQIEQAALTPAA